MKRFLTLVVLSSCCIAVPVRVGVIRGYMSYNRNTVSRDSYHRTLELAAHADGIDIILLPEFAFGGRDGTSWDHPAVYFTWDDSLGFCPHPYDSTNANDILAATYLDSMRYIAMSETCYIWASSCGEVIDGVNYNSIPIYLPDGKIYRIRRKCLYSSHVPTRDTTIHCDSIDTKSGGRIAVMTTICYENSALAPLLDPVEPPAPLWLLPHGTWSAAGDPDMTYRTQRWIWNPSKITLSGVWSIPSDGWVTGDAVLISADIYGTEWTAMGIDNYGNDRDPLAYEPLAWVEEHPTYVVIDCNIPDVSDTLPVVRARPAREPAFDRLTALPKISTGPVFIFAAKSVIEIYAENGDMVETLEPEPEFTVWEGIENRRYRPGKYTIISGGEKTVVTLSE